MLLLERFFSHPTSIIRLPNAMPVLSILEAAWILFTFTAVFFAWPAFVFRRHSNPNTWLRQAANFVRALAFVSMASFGLSHLGAFNTISMLLLFAGAATLSWFFTTAKSLDWKSIQRWVIGVVRQAENLSYTRRLLPPTRPRILTAYQPPNPWPRLLRGEALPTLSLLTVVVMSGILSSQHAVRELRLDQPAEYGALLRSRELMLGLHSESRPLLFPSMIATTSVFSGRDATEVARYLSPLVTLCVALTVGLFVYTFTGSSIATAVAIYCVGAAAFPAVTNGMVTTDSVRGRVLDIVRTSPAEIRPGPELALGIVFVLLGLTFLADWTEHPKKWEPMADFGCCLILTAVISSVLLLLLLGGSAALLVRRWLAPIAVVSLLCGAAIYADLSQRSNLGGVRALLPIAAAIEAGALVALIGSRLSGTLRFAGEMPLLVGCLIAAILWFRPHLPHEQCLEYEAAARTTERIAHDFPHETWAVAAPVEQLSETLGLGVHEDLSHFVEKYRTAVETPQFRFPTEAQDLFVYVEKRPFQIFSKEPAFISYLLLTDPTYRGYRSPAGRASVEAAALALCETYRRHHPNVDIFFEDAELRIYHIRSDSSPGQPLARLTYKSSPL